MIAERIPELQKLTAEEQLILVGELWDALAARPDAFPPREDHVQILEERLAEHRRNPDDVIPWGEVKRRLAAGP